MDFLFFSTRLMLIATLFCYFTDPLLIQVFLWCCFTCEPCKKNKNKQTFQLGPKSFSSWTGRGLARPYTVRTYSISHPCTCDTRKHNQLIIIIILPENKPRPNPISDNSWPKIFVTWAAGRGLGWNTVLGSLARIAPTLSPQLSNLAQQCYCRSVAAAAPSVPWRLFVRCCGCWKSALAPPTRVMKRWTKSSSLSFTVSWFIFAAARQRTSCKTGSRCIFG